MDSFLKPAGYAGSLLSVSGAPAAISRGHHSLDELGMSVRRLACSIRKTVFMRT